MELSRGKTILLFSFLIVFVFSSSVIILLLPQFGFALWGFCLLYAVGTSMVLRRNASGRAKWPSAGVKAVAFFVLVIAFTIIAVESIWVATFDLGTVRETSILSLAIGFVWISASALRSKTSLNPSRLWTIFVIAFGLSEFITLMNIQMMIARLGLPLDLALLNVSIVALVPVAYWSNGRIFESIV